MELEFALREREELLSPVALVYQSGGVGVTGGEGRNGFLDWTSGVAAVVSLVLKCFVIEYEVTVWQILGGCHMTCR